MSSSSLTVSDCVVDRRLWLCRAWLDPTSEFEEVEVVERRHTRVAVSPAGKLEPPISVYARDLWPPEQLEQAREWRRRDLAIAELDVQRPLDRITEGAIDLCSVIACDETWERYLAPTLALLRRLGRPGTLEELHELAYVLDVEPYAFVHAPEQVWKTLYAQFAASERDLVDERLDDAAERLHWSLDRDREASIAMVRRWAGLPPRVPAQPIETDTPAGEVQRLRAIVELAAAALDDAGRPDQALNIRMAAFPHRFAPKDPV